MGGEVRGLLRRCGKGSGKVGEDNTGGGGGSSEEARVWTHSATSVTEEVRVAPPSEVYRRMGGDPAGLELEAGWVEVALARCQTMGRPYLDNMA